MKTIITCVLLGGFILFANDCTNAAPNKFVLTIFRGDKTLLTCHFTGEDSNKDGYLEAGELTSFEETEAYAVSEKNSNTGFAAFTDITTMPMLEHGLEDVRLFNFHLSEFSKGKSVLEYKTDTKRNFKVGKYVFWRIVKIDKNGEVGFFHGVGDGTKGLQLSMLDSAQLRFTVTAD